MSRTVQFYVLFGSEIDPPKILLTGHFTECAALGKVGADTGLENRCGSDQPPADRTAIRLGLAGGLGVQPVLEARHARRFWSTCSGGEAGDVEVGVHSRGE